jgi:hypothetical protein
MIWLPTWLFIQTHFKDNAFKVGATSCQQLKYLMGFWEGRPWSFLPTYLFLMASGATSPTNSERPS